MNEIFKNKLFWIVVAIIIALIILFSFRKKIFTKLYAKPIKEKGGLAKIGEENMNGRRLLISRIVSKNEFSEDLIKGLNQLNTSDLEIVLNGNPTPCVGNAPFKGLYLSKCPE